MMAVNSIDSKPAVSQALRNRVWQKEFGETKYADCPMCGVTTISVWDFETGHIICSMHGGTNEQHNLRPICAKCTKSMGIYQDWCVYERNFKRPDLLPEVMFDVVTTQIRLIEIVAHYNPARYGESTEKYRIPLYQRHSVQSDDWCARLIESILENKHIGNITMSEWSKPDSRGTVVWYNLEDGQRRMSTCHRFYSGEFRTKYGWYKDTQERFNNYDVGLTRIKKARPSVTDQEFFTTLSINFTLLQETRVLTDSQKFWTQMRDPLMGFEGVPLLNFTLDMVNGTFTKEFRKYYAISNGFDRSSPENIKARLATLVTLCSGCINPAMYKLSYTRHQIMMMPTYIIPDREKVVDRLRSLFRAFEDGRKLNTSLVFMKSLLGPMLFDVHTSSEGEFISLWGKVFTECIQPDLTPKEWMDEVVLEGLSTAHSRNAQRKLEFIRNWSRFCSDDSPATGPSSLFSKATACETTTK